MADEPAELVQPQVVDPGGADPDAHRAELGNPSFAAYMKGCRCDDCRSAHRQVSSSARKGKGTRRPSGPARPKKAQAAREQVRQAVTDESPAKALGAVTTEHRGTSSAASQSELEEFAARLLIAATGIVALVLFRPWPELRDVAGMTDDEADLIARELSRYFVGTRVNKEHGARIVQSGGLIAAGVAIFEWGDRVAGALKVARQLNPRPERPQPAQPAQPAPGGANNVPGPTVSPHIRGEDFTG